MPLRKRARMRRLPPPSKDYKVMTIPNPRGLRAEEVDIVKAGVTIFYKIKGAKHG